MADITMCFSRECPSRATCERHPNSATKPRELWQPQYNYDVIRGDADRCGSYVPVATARRDRDGEGGDDGT